MASHDYLWNYGCFVLNRKEGHFLCLHAQFHLVRTEEHMNGKNDTQHSRNIPHNLDES